MARSRVSAMKKARELFLLCLIATLAAHLAMTQDDTLCTIFLQRLPALPLRSPSSMVATNSHPDSGILKLRCGRVFVQPGSLEPRAPGGGRQRALHDRVGCGD
jgi:hypothetical protein